MAPTVTPSKPPSLAVAIQLGFNVTIFYPRGQSRLYRLRKINLPTYFEA
jgi:hypothetical protein